MNTADYKLTTSTSSDFLLCPPSPDGQEIFRRTAFDSSDLSTTNNNFRSCSSVKYPQNPRKKRTKMLRLDTNSVPISKPKQYGGKKPDPTAPKITRPCSECGKKFWSWKALFGHMRCHPERQWRGINPPPNFRKLDGTGSDNSFGEVDLTTRMTDEDHHVATCLLMLANGPTARNQINPTAITSAAAVTTTAVTSPVSNLADSETGFRDVCGASGFGDSDGSGRFECSGCNKVFGSHQALGGHRASHKNVKGCFAITKNEGEDDHAGVHQEGGSFGHFMGADHERMINEGIRNLTSWVDGVAPEANNGGVHRCGICFRVFSSGQALGGHKRCHWEKLGDETTTANNIAGGSSSVTQGLNVGSFCLQATCGLDLNMPAPLYDEPSSASNYSSCLALDLRLGL